MLMGVAGSILFLIGGLHSFLGERLVFPRLFALAELPLLRRDRAYTENVLRFAWHLTSLAWWGLSALLFALAASPHNQHVLGLVLGAVPFLSGLVILFSCGPRHPAWSLFLLAGSLIWVSMG